MTIRKHSKNEQHFAQEAAGLLKHHFEQLHVNSGLSIKVIRERGYRSVQRKKELATLGFVPSQSQVPGLLLPVYGPDGSNSLYCYRPDRPRIKDGKELKYEFAKSAVMRLDVPPRCRAALGDPSKPLWITEGIKKGDALASRSLIVATLLGVWNFKGTNEFGGVTLLADFDYIALNGRTVYIVFDSDVITKIQVQKALERLIEHLQRKGAKVSAIYLPPGPNGSKVGVDDFLLDHKLADLKKLAEAPRPACKPAPPRLKLLDAAPPALTRPLDIIDGHAYAATWIWVQKETHESLDRQGNIVRHERPIVEKIRQLIIARDDGVLFGPDGNALFETGVDPAQHIAFEIDLNESPREEKLWRGLAVERYRQGWRPKLNKLFDRIVGAFDHFLDFKLSVARQQDMCEFSACAVLVTWFAAAFTVLGYFWPTGERGSGKTKWGICWAAISYLGETVLSSGSFAALRDVANLGGSMMFDDAEILCDPKRGDANKRELLLAGNRRGAQIPIKEPKSTGGWTTKWINTYSPRAFTAIHTPDPVLASRTITIPLVRTADSSKGNLDPADTARWPCDQRRLVDHLWATALSLQAEAKEIWNEFDAETAAVGREFEPWRGILAVARLFERHGVAGLENRMRDLMENFRKERPDIIGEDRTVLVIRSVLQKADIEDISDVSDVKSEVEVSASEIAEMIKNTIDFDETLNVDWASARSVGRILSRLRFHREREPNRMRNRSWKINKIALLGMASAYGIVSDKPAEKQAKQRR